LTEEFAVESTATRESVACWSGSGEPLPNPPILCEPFTAIRPHLRNEVPSDHCGCALDGASSQAAYLPIPPGSRRRGTSLLVYQEGRLCVTTTVTRPAHRLHGVWCINPDWWRTDVFLQDQTGTAPTRLSQPRRSVRTPPDAPPSRPPSSEDTDSLTVGGTVTPVQRQKTLDGRAFALPAVCHRSPQPLRGGGPCRSGQPVSPATPATTTA